MIRDIPDLQQCNLAVLCTQSQLSVFTIKSLINNGIIPRILILPGIEVTAMRTSEFRVIAETVHHPASPIEDLAQVHGIPVSHEQLINPKKFAERLLAQSINLLLIACFPYKIPPIIRESVCCLNIHPSLLPAYKGPSPLFWQLFNNEPTIGVSLHFLSDDWDSGELVSQVSVKRLSGLDEARLNQQLADSAGTLVKHTLTGNITRPENPHAASYFKAPQDEDFQIKPEWKVQHAFDFMSGTLSWNHDYRFTAKDGRQVRLRKPITTFIHRDMNQAFIVEGEQVTIALQDGALLAVLSVRHKDACS